eukprot:3467437-Alexandrium_andersonii.AAC.1
MSCSSEIPRNSAPSEGTDGDRTVGQCSSNWVASRAYAYCAQARRRKSTTCHNGLPRNDRTMAAHASP